ncbi:MAG: hypothetical protein UH824_00740 [Acutalibacteraceae bacterium]|nr:hypothetical protein [Acutalibacteraceae bacterium]
MVNFDVIECEIIMPSSEKELKFESKIARMQKLLNITKSEAVGIVIRSLWTAIGNGFYDGNWQGLNSSDIEKAIGYNKKPRLFGVLIVSGILTPKLYVADWADFGLSILKLYDNITGDTLNKPSLTNVACDMGYDEYNDKNSLVEIMRGINRYNLTYKEKIELCILTISLFAEYFMDSPTALDVENMYKLLQNDIFIRGKMQIKSNICESLESAFESCLDSDCGDDVWQSLRKL